MRAPAARATAGPGSRPLSTSRGADTPVLLLSRHDGRSAPGDLRRGQRIHYPDLSDGCDGPSATASGRPLHAAAVHARRAHRRALGAVRPGPPDGHMAGDRSGHRGRRQPALLLRRPTARRRQDRRLRRGHRHRPRDGGVGLQRRRPERRLRLLRLAHRPGERLPARLGPVRRRRSVGLRLRRHLAPGAPRRTGRRRGGPVRGPLRQLDAAHPLPARGRLPAGRPPRRPPGDHAGAQHRPARRRQERPRAPAPRDPGHQRAPAADQREQPGLPAPPARRRPHARGPAPHRRRRRRDRRRRPGAQPEQRRLRGARRPRRGRGRPRAQAQGPRPRRPRRRRRAHLHRGLGPAASRACSRPRRRTATTAFSPRRSRPRATCSASSACPSRGSAPSRRGRCPP